VVVYGSTIGLEASCSSKSVWTAGNALYDLEADVRIFSPGVPYQKEYFEPWGVDPEPALRVVDFLIGNDRDLKVNAPSWGPGSVPLFIRVIKFLGNGLNSYFLVVAKGLVSKALVSLILKAVRAYSRFLLGRKVQ
jgi:hypothetical protein